MSQCTWYRCERLISHVFGLQDFRSEGEVALLLARTNVKRLLAEARGLEELKTELSEIYQWLLHQS